MPQTLTIGAVPFLNGRPLIHGLESAPGVRVRLEVPSALGTLLRSGEVDAALVPAVEYARLAAEGGERARGQVSGAGGRRYVALPVAAIGSRGAAGSALLVGYGEPDRLRRVLLDPASRTSNALARLVIGRRMGGRPHFLMPEEVGPDPVRPADAEVVIGDRALVPDRAQARWVRDLGDEWHRWTRLPFVYAFWAARADGPIARLTALLAEARDRGLAAREALAVEAAPALGLSAEAARRYLVDQMRYGFGPREQKGLRVFLGMAAEDGLAPEGARVVVARGGSAAVDGGPEDEGP